MSLKVKSLKTDFIRFVVPTIFTIWIYHFYIIADGIFVSRGVSQIGLGAVNIAHPYTNVLFSIGVLIAVGTSTITAIYMGRKETKYANAIFTQSIIVLGVIGLVITMAVMLNLDYIASFLGAKDETFHMVREYIRGIAPFSTSLILSYYLEVLIKTDGYPYKAMIIVAIGCGINCVLDYLFIFIFNLGVWGAAFATGLSQTLIVTLYLCHFIFGKSGFRLTKFKTDFNLLGRVALIGVPEGITELCTGLTVFMFNRVIISFLGEGAIVYYTVSAYVSTLVIMTMVAIAHGIQPLVSFYLGRGDLDKCKKLLKYGFAVSGTISFIAFLGTNLLANQIVGAFFDDPTSKEFLASVYVFRKFSLSFLFVGISVVISGFLTAMGQPRGAFIISLGRGFALPVGVLMALAYATGGSGIWWAQAIAELVCVVIAVALLAGEKKHFGKLKLGNMVKK
ncbi:MAG: MATE family efflux transporter [Eubacteriales bacterium]|nr:MATE family efflux transporter [Eubacteriales bacterium]